MKGFLAAATDPLVLQTGLTCLGLHWVLYAICKFVLPDGPWKKMPGHTAHQALALPLMAYVSYQGCVVWFSSATLETPEDRIKIVSKEGVHLAQVIFGFLLYWDIPLGLIHPPLRDTIMLGHHVGMLFVAAVVMGDICVSGEPRGSYYSAFFLGVIETSSIPLTYVDVFHPKHKYWYDYLQELVKKKSPIGNALNSINEISRILFAVLFLILRFCYFPYVAISICIPDFWEAANQESDPALYYIFVACLLFTGLQMYWGLLILRQIAKMFKADGDGDKKKK